ncbi:MULTISPECIES: hypothetical protein [Bradyrhizobium]|uniref:hypothetical protein n=1 Tax=Bradyrhizobium TaxID=374 RepID=UPI001EDBEDFA|nr:MULTISPECIES: hypothetical protein [Bradyrhizobium]MCG2640600.1 hypothetical protein [Bradyrhizobium zhengyangense]
MRSLLVISTTALGIVITFACATSIFCYLTGQSAASAGCSGREMLEGYRSNLSDFLALPFFSFFIVAMIVVFIRRLHKGGIAALDGVPLSYYLPPAYFSLFLLIAMSGWTLFWVVTRYNVIWSYCQVAH